MHSWIGVRILALAAGLAWVGPAPPAQGAGWPALRDSYDAELQAALDAALYAEPIFRAKLKNKSASIVLVDVTRDKQPEVAGYNPELMLYAASLPKIAIVLGAFVEIDAGRLALDDELRRQLVRMVKVSSNRDATAVLNKVGSERLAEILQDPKHGKLYDPAHGGGLWVGKAYDKSPAWKRDPIHGISQGASAMAAARFFYGAANGTLIDEKHRPLLQEIFGEPALQHKFVKGLKGRDVAIYRKSGTWRHYHSDAGVVVHPDGGAAYIVAAIGHNTQGGDLLVKLIRVVDDLMQERNGSGSGQGDAGS
jgi:beta-lactamase class A